MAKNGGFYTLGVIIYSVTKLYRCYKTLIGMFNNWYIVSGLWDYFRVDIKSVRV